MQAQYYWPEDLNRPFHKGEVIERPSRDRAERMAELIREFGTMPGVVVQTRVWCAVTGLDPNAS